MTAFIADYLVAKNNQVKVVHNVNVSPHALDLLTKKGVELIRAKVGHSNIKAVMREENADFGGEHSAHFYYKENFFADSAILTLLVFLNIISEKNQSINEMISAYNFPPSSGEINFKVGSKGCLSTPARYARAKPAQQRPRVLAQISRASSTSCTSSDQ